MSNHPIRRRGAVWLLLLLGGGLPASAVRATPINSNIALSASQGQIMIRAGGKFFGSSGVNSMGRGDVDVRVVPTAIVYGITARDNILLIAPYVSKDLDLRLPSGRSLSRSSSGLGDLSLIWKRRVYRFDDVSETERVALLLGLQTPTGEYNQRDVLGKLPRPLQPGSGAPTVLVGGVYSHVKDRVGFHGDFVYRATTRAHGYEFGDRVQYDLTAEYRLLPTRFPGTQLNLVLELNGVFALSDRAGGRVPNTGGHTLFLSPGLQAISRDGGWVAEVSVLIPIVRDAAGRQFAADTGVFFSIRRFTGFGHGN